MNGKERLYDTLLQLGTVLREKRAHAYGVGWDMHRKKVEAVCEADKKYMDLLLTNEQKEIIEEMLEKRMEANECELTLTYIAGILDGITYLRDAGFLDLYVVNGEEPPKKPDQLIDFVRKWVEKEIEIYVISRPEAYAEYGPYTFVVSLKALDHTLESYTRKGDGK